MIQYTTWTSVFQDKVRLRFSKESLVEAGIRVYNPFVRRSPHDYMISHSCKGSQQSSYTGHMSTLSTDVLIQKKERVNTKRHPEKFQLCFCGAEGGMLRFLDAFSSSIMTI